MQFKHRNIRLPRTSYRGHGLFFITLCCDQREPVFAEATKAHWVIGALRAEADAHRFAVHAYCVMPDHLHALLEALATSSDLLRFVRVLKQKTTRAHSRDSGGRLWQKKFYDHILRRDEAVDAVAWYIWANPVRAGLSSRPQDYPYSGSFTMDWKPSSPSSEQWVPAWSRGRRA